MAEVWSWGVAQILVMMWEHGLTTMMRVHKQDTLEGLVALLLDQMRATLDRFFNITDSTARVLGGGVSLRYEGRMVPVYQNLTNDIFVLGWTEGCAQEMLLEAAGLKLESLKSTLKGLIDEARPFAAVDKRVRATKALEDAVKDELSSLQIRKQQLRIAAASKVAVLFDFDGTLGDTETPAMEVAFWELAPYFPNITPAQLTPTMMNDYIRLNAGKAFEFMLEKVEEDRKAAGLPPIEEVRALYSEDTAVLALVNAARAALGLAALELTREDHPSLLAKQKDETVESLRLLARPCDGVIKALNFLKISGFKYAISTNNPKPRVPVCVDTARLRDWFPDDKIHSGESDFNPPRFKPDPAVYLKAAAAERVPVTRCIAVEDSVTGVGSAANANVSLIIGFVGGSHIIPESQDAHALSLLLGRSISGGCNGSGSISDHGSGGGSSSSSDASAPVAVGTASPCRLARARRIPCRVAAATGVTYATAIARRRKIASSGRGAQLTTKASSSSASSATAATSASFADIGKSSDSSDSSGQKEGGGVKTSAQRVVPAAPVAPNKNGGAAGPR
mmetsp:Transcript_6446/g.16460  ORF Transcript_6446/g.16460 Transcript_6446/m.16460 type:complete len:564 (-) Transcript_6446:389-2080(-)